MAGERESVRRLMVAINRVDGIWYLLARKSGMKVNTISLLFALDDGKYGKGIINNCKTKIILNMEDEEAQRVKNILHLSETEVMNITHFQRGNGLISTNNNNITVEFKASNLEKELITTDRQELLEILKRQNEKAG